MTTPNTTENRAITRSRAFDEHRDLVPDQPVVDQPTTSNKRRASKAVRTRKRDARRVMLNKFSAEKLKRALDGNIVHVDGQDFDFGDAFAFFTWYLDNYARLDDVPYPLALEFRKQYLAFNLDQAGQEFIIENVKHKFLFDPAYYEKYENSDSDESIPDSRHKPDSHAPEVDVDIEMAGDQSPTYQPMSPVYMNSTECDEFSDEERAKQMRVEIPQPESPEPIVQRNEDQMFTKIPVDRKPRLLYVTVEESPLLEKITPEICDQINGIKRRILRLRSGNLKLRYDVQTFYYSVRNLLHICPRGEEPIFSISDEMWNMRSSYIMPRPQFIVKESDHAICEVVVMG